jgi:DNA-binding response OmpR family regulator
METLRGLDILVVEDDADIRTMLCAALEYEGYTVDGAATAEAGLERLAARHYHLVLTDFMLPANTGAWLLREASRRGLLTDTERLMVTAQDQAERVDAVTTLYKPLDLDHLFDTVHRLLAPAREAEAEGIKARFAAAPQTEPRQPVVDLVLYIGSASPSSLKALRTVERLLARVQPGQVRFTVRDLSREPASAAEDHIAFTPTLVKRYPEPRTWIRGDLEDGAIVADLLRHAGVAGEEGT